MPNLISDSTAQWIRQQQARSTASRTRLDRPPRDLGETILVVGRHAAANLTPVREGTTRAPLADALRVIEIVPDGKGGMRAATPSERAERRDGNVSAPPDYRLAIDADRLWLGNIRMDRLLAFAKYFERDGQPRRFTFQDESGEPITTRFLALDPDSPEATEPSADDEDYPPPCGHPGNLGFAGSGDGSGDHPIMIEDHHPGNTYPINEHPGDAAVSPPCRK